MAGKGTLSSRSTSRSRSSSSSGAATRLPEADAARRTTFPLRATPAAWTNSPPTSRRSSCLPRRVHHRAARSSTVGQLGRPLLVDDRRTCTVDTSPDFDPVDLLARPGDASRATTGRGSRTKGGIDGAAHGLRYREISSRLPALARGELRSSRTSSSGLTDGSTRRRRRPSGHGSSPTQIGLRRGRRTAGARPRAGSATSAGPEGVRSRLRAQHALGARRTCHAGEAVARRRRTSGSRLMSSARADRPGAAIPRTVPGRARRGRGDPAHGLPDKQRDHREPVSSLRGATSLLLGLREAACRDDQHGRSRDGERSTSGSSTGTSARRTGSTWPRWAGSRSRASTSTWLRRRASGARCGPNSRPRWRSTERGCERMVDSTETCYCAHLEMRHGRSGQRPV